MPITEREIWLDRLECTAQDLESAARAIDVLINEWPEACDTDVTAAAELALTLRNSAFRLRERAGEEKAKTREFL